jgi:hypothetical protein
MPTTFASFLKNLIMEQSTFESSSKITQRKGAVEQGSLLRGLVTVMRVPKDEQENGPWAPFIQFDSYTILNTVPEEFLGKKVYALVEFGGAGLANLLEAVPVSGSSGDLVPEGDLNNKQITLVVGVITTGKSGSILTGGIHRIISMEEDLTRLKNRRIVATASGLGQFDTDSGGYFEAFMVEEYSILRRTRARIDLLADRAIIGDQDEDDTFIYQAVEGGQLTILKTFPPTLCINAVGETTTTGWSNFNLAPHYYTVEPADGIYEFDFLGKSPSPDDIVNQTLTSCVAVYAWPAYPTTHVKGVRIRTDTNNVEIML